MGATSLASPKFLKFPERITNFIFLLIKKGAIDATIIALGQPGCPTFLFLKKIKTTNFPG